MNFFNKKRSLISIILLIIIIFFLGYWGSNAIQKDSYIYGDSVTKFIPKNIKDFLKKTVFIVPTLKKQLSKKNIEINNLESVITKKGKELHKLYEIYKFIPFYKNLEGKLIKTNSNIYKLTSFKTDALFNYKGQGLFKASAYLDYFDKNIFLTSGDGVVSFFNIENMSNENFNASIISSNISKKINNPKFYREGFAGIKDLLIYKNKIFVSFSNAIKKNCYNISILSAELNYEYLEFKDFFIPDSCIQNLSHAQGGRIYPYTDNKIIFSMGDWRSGELVKEYRVETSPQNINNLFGKIISIDITTKKYEIISIGHRNPQGLYFNENKNIIFSTEHGPKGGDEININLSPKTNEIENFGWPIASYGEHYGFKERDDNHVKYKNAPLYKSHSKYGFIEPIKYYVPSIGISEIIQVPNNYFSNTNNNFLIASMGSKITEGDLSIHHISLNDSFNEIISADTIPIGERIRDMIYIKDHKKVFLFLETSASIGILELN